MRRIGFSTGALARGDFRKGIHLQESYAEEAKALELSALREDELAELVDAIPQLDLRTFEYVSFHAPSSRIRFSEQELVSCLTEVAKNVRNIIVHPDIIDKPSAWESIQEFVVLENMDQRKAGARTAIELKRFFDALPKARFCFDIGHARQVDPSLSVAVELLRAFANRLSEIHISEVDAASRHVAISSAAMSSYRRIAPLIPRDIPVIVESSVPPDSLVDEIKMALASLGDRLPDRAAAATTVSVG